MKTPAGAQPFFDHHRRYDQWFARHDAAYQSELLAVRTLLPWHGTGLEVGVGTGRFAAPLGVGFGVDPAPPVLAYAARRGVQVVGGVAEALPFADARFDYVLIVTAICFVPDARATLAEVRRVLSPGGRLVIGLIDRESPLGREYLAHQAENVFYRKATFYSAAEIDDLLTAGGFGPRTWVQTLSRPLEATREIEPVRAGTGTGAFIVVGAETG